MTGIIFVADSILEVLIFIEALILSLFFLILLTTSRESFFEILVFLVVVVGERILGLVLIILKVGITGVDFFDLGNVI